MFCKREAPRIYLGASFVSILIFLYSTSRIVSGPSHSHDIPDDVEDDIICYASPILKENIEFLKSTIKEIGAEIPGI